MSTYFHVYCSTHGELNLFYDRTHYLLNHAEDKLLEVCQRSRDLLKSADLLRELSNIDLDFTKISFEVLPPIILRVFVSLPCGYECQWQPRSEYDR